MNGSDQQYKSGLPYALGAHAIWGSMPLYLLLVKTVPSLEFVAWRLIFTVPLCGVIVATRRLGPELRQVLRDGRTMLTLLGSATTIAVNWFLYVHAIQTGHVYAASLGYYILPLMMMLLGLVVAVIATSAAAQWAGWDDVATLEGLGVVADSLPTLEWPLLRLVPVLIPGRLV